MLKSVIFSEKAFRSILVETQEKIKTETGGVFLGQIIDNVRYIIESADPGPNSIFSKSYFEYDQKYVTHLINKISRLYEIPLELIGLWHRHPSSFDSFSKIDDITNAKYAELNNEGAISAIVNIDPVFRLTIYSVDLPLKYSKINFLVGDGFIPGCFLRLKGVECIQKQISRENYIVSKKTILKNKDFVDDISLIPISQFSLNKILEKYIKSRTYEDVKTLNIDNLQGCNDEERLVILSLVEKDLKFLSCLGIDYKIQLDEIGNISLKENNYQNFCPFSAKFTITDNKVFFVFEDSAFIYHEGLIKEAYLEFLY